MIISKVKYNGSQITIEYTADNGDEITIKSNDEPNNDFKTALYRLKNHFAAICELGEVYCQTIEVRGVSFSNAHDIMGAVITGLRPLETSNAPLVLNTPHLPESDYSGEENDWSKLLPEACVKDLHELLAQTENYIKGHRAQLNLFEEAA